MLNMMKLRGSRLSLGSWSLPFQGAVRSNRKYQSSGAIATGNPDLPDTNMDNLSSLSKPTARAPSDASAGRASSQSLTELAATISKETAKLDRFLKDSESKMPGFDIDSPLNLPKLPDAIKKARGEIVRATKELNDLVTGPTESVRWLAWDVN